jgi:uncharacterized protein YqgV (UPF0045/DUF77 family)
MYPLQESYEEAILDFIDRLNTYKDVEVRTNGMSTQIFGEYDRVMEVLQQEIKTSFEAGIPMCIVCKLLNVDTSGYGNK